MLHLPVLRAGRPYRSLDTITLTDVRSGEPVATVSQAGAAMIAHDMAGGHARRRRLQEIGSAARLDICRKAAGLFIGESLPAGDRVQSPADYVACLSATTGMPEALCRANMKKIHFVLDRMDVVLAGLTRGLDLDIVDAGHGVMAGRPVAYVCEADRLGAVLPSNSPGVHSLWIPAVALGVPVVLRPGSREPWTPVRIAQALIAAGLPPEAISFYPGGHDGATEIVLRSERSMVFGDESTVLPWVSDPRVQIHGPGWSKVLLADAAASSSRDHLDLMVTSIAANGGRSCINASGVWTTSGGEALADALAGRLARMSARPLDDPEASLAAFSDPDVASRIDQFIEQRLAVPGARDITAEVRGTPRRARVDGCTFLLPTIIHVTEPDHPLAAAEFLFPFAAVVERPRESMLSALGPTLVCTAITGDPALARELMDCGSIERLNLGPIPTTQVSWDQPHEGNLFEHLFRQRAFCAARNGRPAGTGAA
ncbi:MAG: aldehyde dehydrogenase family protein [Acidobacteriota bacterium]